MWANFIGCKRCSDHQAPHKRIDSYLILVRRKFAAIFLSPFYKPRPALPTTSDPVIISIISQRKKEIRLRLKVLFNVRGFFFFLYFSYFFFFSFVCSATMINILFLYCYARRLCSSEQRKLDEHFPQNVIFIYILCSIPAANLPKLPPLISRCSLKILYFTLKL